MTQTPPKQDNSSYTPPLNVQLTPDYLYTISNGSTVLAQIVATSGTSVQVVGSSTQPSLAYTEYWYVSAAALANLVSTSGVTLIIQAARLTGSVTLDQGVTYAFNSAEATTWSTSLTPPGTGTNCIFSGSPTSPAGTTVYILLNITSSGGQCSLTAVQWYVTGLPTNLQNTSWLLEPGSSAGNRYVSTNTLPTSYWGAASH
jgi:hypothetical protein